ncbi:hypothetical protein [Paenibacillus daejeonensis]|uniref:hypothetical protein n=1 Tax=Paenibacillus daejeonensis TaxID=135193 RepID=UPI00037073FE|nr:hypothetical protein [Paenibacillus daejeonensis]
MKVKTTVAIAALTLLLIAGGCSGESADETTPPAPTPTNEQGSITFETPAGGEMTASSENKRSEMLHEDIPLPDQVIISATMEQPDQGAVTISFDVKQPLEEVIQLYKDAITTSGFTETMPTTQEEDHFWFSGTRDNEQLVVILNKNFDQDGWVYGSIAYTNKG